jgi:tungstate transport system substrate-binding protein
MFVTGVPMKTNRGFRFVILALGVLLLAPFSLFAKGSGDSPASGSASQARPAAVSGTASTTTVALPLKGTVILSTTTSTQDSGLLNYLLPVFTRETGWEVKTIAVGTGAALKMGRDGEADVLLVHARADELKFVADGFGLKRFDVMYNDFIVVGPAGPIGHNDDVRKTFKAIADQNLPFVSRGDDSGTHKMELTLWKDSGVDVKKLGKYTSAGQGMGATLQISGELNAYTLSDRATWLTQKNSTLNIVCEKSAELLNYYGVIAVNPSLNSKINAEGGQAFVDWFLKDSTQELIGQYGVKEYGGALFTPNAKANS